MDIALGKQGKWASDTYRFVYKTYKDKSESAQVSVEEDIIGNIRSLLLLIEDPDSNASLATIYKKIAPNSVDRVKLIQETTKLAATNLITPNEYLEYRLYNKTQGEKNSYISGLKLYDLWNKLNDRKFLHFDDKDLANKLIRYKLGNDHATEDLGTFNSQEISKKELINYTPFFMKPIDGVGGIDTILAYKYNRLSDSFVTPIGKMGYEELKERMNDKDYLISKVVKSSFKPSFTRHSKGLNTIRFVTLRGNVVGAVYKLSRGLNWVDNFNTSGNYAVAIDLDNGHLFNTAYRGKDYLGNAELKVKRAIVPDWDDLVSFVEKAAKVFRPTKLIGFDIAVTDKGPVIIDFNATPGIRLLQIPYQMGFKRILK